MKLILTILVASFSVAILGQESKRTIDIDDILNIKIVREVEISPDNRWIAYTVSRADTSKDKSFTQFWMVSTNGGDPIPMTSEEYSASRPRWSPDNKYLSFLSAKGEKTKPQVWNLNRFGGEAQQVTKVRQGVSSYEWSPDGKKLLLVIKDPKPSDLTKESKDAEAPLPHVIDRIHFKQDNAGYLDRRRDHLYVYTPGDSAAIQITSGDYDDSEPQWSPDGKLVAFTSNRSNNPDLSFNSDIWIVSADNANKGAEIKQVRMNPVSDSNPKWSPDGKSIAYITSIDEDIMPFSMREVALASIESGEIKILTRDLDRRPFNPSFSEDGKSIFFGLNDKGEKYLAKVDLDGNSFERVLVGEVTLIDYAVTEEAVYTLHSTSEEPGAIYKLENGKLNQITKANNELLTKISLGSFNKTRFKSKDSIEIEGFVVKPPQFDPELKYPLILWIHGGPISQFSYNLYAPYHLFASRGYVVLLVNPRGSLGYGEDFCKAIFADWGNKDFDDVMAGVDHLIAQGYIDENKLGVGGWSYGGILTNYVITKTSRFKAAISGASLGNATANFGHDQYVKWYNAEFGMPWENRALWERLSPFNEVEKITTPTLWMGGAVDWNVPIMNSEQMYLAMKSLGQETQLIVYPGEHHSIRRPSFQKDRLERWIGWFDKYMK